MKFGYLNPETQLLGLRLGLLKLGAAKAPADHVFECGLLAKAAAGVRKKRVLELRFLLEVGASSRTWSDFLLFSAVVCLCMLM